jgi:hypothetical protein
MKTYMNRMKSILLLSLLVAQFTASAQAEGPEQSVEPVVTYIVDSNVAVTKACIGDQFYLITRQSNGASGITPALREGKPEQCDSMSTRKQPE